MLPLPAEEHKRETSSELPATLGILMQNQARETRLLSLPYPIAFSPWSTQLPPAINDAQTAWVLAESGPP